MIKSKRGEDGALGALIAVLVVGVFVIAFVSVIAGFDTVDVGHKAVLVQFGELKGEMNAGMKWTGLFVDAVPFNLKERRMIVTLVGDNAASDKDGQNVFAEVQINYRLKSDMITAAYTQVGKDEDLEKILNMEGIVREGFKSAVVKYTAMETMLKRDELKQLTIDKITEKFPSKYFELENVVIANLDFNVAYKQAIESKKVAEEVAKATENQVQISKYEADKKIETARGEAESMKLSAAADAYKIEVKAKAEAEALRLKSQELTPMMVQNNWIDRWDGKLPVYQFGENANMLVSIPEQK